MKWEEDTAFQDLGRFSTTSVAGGSDALIFGDVCSAEPLMILVRQRFQKMVMV